MKKLTFLMLLGFIISAMSLGIYAASDKINESSDIKIVVDSNLKKTSDVPIIVSGRTLVPLREVSNLLGVSNDEEHIKWDPVQKSVSLKKDNNNIILKIDSKTATINGTEQTLDVAPLIYKQRTYVPVRFISQGFDKKVVWDPSSKGVFVCNEEDYSNVKDILDKSNQAMKNITRGKFDATMNATSNGLTMDMLKMNSEYDISKNIANSTIEVNLGIFNMKTQIYEKDNVVYSKNPMTNVWEKEVKTPDEFTKEIQKNRTIGEINGDIISAGLRIDNSENPDEIVLVGDTYSSNLLNDVSNEKESDSDSSFSEVESFKLRIVLSKDSYYVKQIVMDTKGKTQQTNSSTNIESNMKLTINYKDLNKDFEITQPSDLDISKAVVKPVSE